MKSAGPREKFVEGCGDLFVAVGIVAGEENRGIWLAGGGYGSPIKIAGAVCRKAEALAPTLGGKVGRVLLAFEIEWEEGFYPFGGIF